MGRRQKEFLVVKEKVLLEASLLFPVTPLLVYLGHKERYIGAGFLNGAGGGIEKGEDEFVSAIREAKQEWGLNIDPASMSKVAVIHSHTKKSNGESFTCRVHVLFAHAWKGSGTASREMGEPLPFARARPPLQYMMPGDKVWFPHVLAGKTIIADVWYGPHQRTLLGKGVVWREVLPVELLRLHPDV